MVVLMLLGVGVRFGFAVTTDFEDDPDDESDDDEDDDEEEPDGTDDNHLGNLLSDALELHGIDDVKYSDRWSIVPRGFMIKGSAWENGDFSKILFVRIDFFIRK